MNSRTQFHEVRVNTGPANPVLTTLEAKAFMRLAASFTTDDTVIDNLVTTATKKIEAYLNRSLITQTLEAYYSSYGAEIYPPNGPIQSVTSVTQISRDNNESVLINDSDYYLKGLNDLYIEFGGAYVLPAGHSVRDKLANYSLKTIYVAGYGDDSTDIPEPIIEAVARLVLYLYDHRDEVVIGAAINNFMIGMGDLLSPYVNVDL